MQLLNIILFWVFFGFLTSYIAKKRGRTSKLWFLIGLSLGIFGVLLATFLPKKMAAVPYAKPLIVSRPSKSDAWIKMWYYLDRSGQQGPLEFSELITTWKQKKLSENSFVWGEGMAEWKRLIDLPELVKEMEEN